MIRPILPHEIEQLQCCLCGRKFSISDHLAKSGLIKLSRQYGDLYKTAIHSICHDCLETHRPRIKRISGGKVIIKPHDPLKGLFYLFICLVIVSAIALCYSLSKTLLNLWNFPFNWYIGLLIFITLLSFLFKAFRSTVKGLFKPPWRRLIISIIIVLSITFLVRTFRYIFYSYLPTVHWKVGITALFVIALCFQMQLIQLFVLRLFSRFRNFALNQLSFFTAFIMLFCFLSPFYFGVITMNPRSEGTIKSENVDKIYEEKFSTEEAAPSEAARRYFVEGKQCASKGNRAGFVKSIQLYKMALELIPNFSSAYAETAYSYASIGKILMEGESEKSKIEDNLEKAEKAIDDARTINQENPTVFAIDLLVQYIMAKYYLSHKREYELTHDLVQEKASKIKWAKGDGLNRLRRIGQKSGFTDKVYLAEAILTENRIKKGSSLLTIIEELDSENAEVHNLLGLIYYLVNDKESAKRMFERAKRLSPDYGEPYLNIALVYPKKEVPGLYKEASNKDNDVTSLAGYYSTLFRNMNYIQWFFGALALAWFFEGYVVGYKYLPKNSQGDIDYEACERNFPEIQKRCQEKTKKFRLSLILIFIGTYIVFETWVHFIHPINGLNHMFPIGFPFF